MSEFKYTDLFLQYSFPILDACVNINVEIIERLRTLFFGRIKNSKSVNIISNTFKNKFLI